MLNQARVRFIATLGALALGAGLLTACGSDSDTSTEASGSTGSSGTTASSNPSGTTANSAGSDTDGSSSDTSAGDGTTSDTAASEIAPSGDPAITIPIAAGWSEDVAVSHLWKYLLDQRGYDVSLTTLDIGPIFDGVANGKFDMFFDASLPVTHKKYWDRYGDKVTDFGPWFDHEQNTIAVPDFVDIDSIDQLTEIADAVDKKIVGIDAGAGITGITKNDMIPAYGLDKAGWELQTSSTAAMLASLKKAIADHEPIVVTLWHPHWAYSAFPLKDLKDPKATMGKPDKLHTIGTSDFAEAHPELVEPLKNFHLSDDELSSLETVTVQDPDMTNDEITEAAGTWAEKHPDVIDRFME